MMQIFRPKTYRNDDGLSLLEVVVSMVILSIISAFVASFVAVSLRSITRAEATSTAATIAQEQLDRLLAVPIKQWGYDDQGRLRPPETKKVEGKNGLTYEVTRELSMNTSNLDVQDACPATIGQRTSRADMVALKLTVNTNTGTFKDSYTTTTYIARDGNATFLKSSLTIKFNVSRGKNKTPYEEGRDGDPIHVFIKDHFRNSRGRGEDNNIDGKTKGGCITFLELKGKSPTISFDLGDYRLNDGRTRYEAKVNMISGGHRELVFDLFRTAKMRVVPKVTGIPGGTCDKPLLMRMHTPIAAPKNRALEDLTKIARVSASEANRLNGIAESARSNADKARLASYEKWQYYMVCQGSDGKYSGSDYTYWFLLADTIPFSILEGGDVRPAGRWSGSQFTPVAGTNGLLERADWPLLEIDNPKFGWEEQSIFAGSCLMNDGDKIVPPKVLRKEDLENAMTREGRIELPLWGIPLEGWYKATHPDAGYKGYLPLVIKNLNDSPGMKDPKDGQRISDRTGDNEVISMFGDKRIADLNKNWYSGCKDSPVFDAGWMQDVNLRDNYAQMRLALPYGLYTYAIYNPTETVNVDGRDVTRSRNTCYPYKRSDRYAGERACIPSGASRVTHYQTDVRVAYRPAYWGGGENIYRKRFFDWNDPEKGPYPIPRGPILDACEANGSDTRYCPGGATKDPFDRSHHAGNDDKHRQGELPKFGEGNNGNAGGGAGGGNPGGSGNPGGGGNAGGGTPGGSGNPGGNQNWNCYITDDHGRQLPALCPPGQDSGEVLPNSRNSGGTGGGGSRQPGGSQLPGGSQKQPGSCYLIDEYGRHIWMGGPGCARNPGGP